MVYIELNVENEQRDRFESISAALMHWTNDKFNFDNNLNGWSLLRLI